MFSCDTSGMRKEIKQVSEFQIFKSGGLCITSKNDLYISTDGITNIIHYFLIKQPFDKKLELYYFMIHIIIPISGIVLFD